MQGARCMDCGVPFCQSDNGCPIDNLIPEWNDLVYQGRWRDALDRLAQDQQLPRVHGPHVPGAVRRRVRARHHRSGRHDQEHRERDHRPRLRRRLGRAAAARGAHRQDASRSSAPGPAGLAAADQLNKAGHEVTVYERADRIGGLLMYGIPNMKLDKQVVSRRVELLRADGHRVRRRTPTSARTSIAAKLRARARRVLLATGATQPARSADPGRELSGIHFAMEFLTANTKSLLDEQPRGRQVTSAPRTSDVIVIGGGDTGADCIGTSLRHGCQSLVNFELLDQPPAKRAADNPWPQWPKILRIDYGHEEVDRALRRRSAQLRGRVEGVRRRRHGGVGACGSRAVEVARGPTGRAEDGRGRRQPRTLEADLVLLAMGFLGPGGVSRAKRSASSSTARSNYRPSTASSRPACRACSRPATAAAANRSSSGRSTRAAARRARSTSS